MHGSAPAQPNPNRSVAGRPEAGPFRSPTSSVADLRLPPPALSFLLLLLLTSLITSCRSPARHATPPPRPPFAFHSDTFAYANALLWEYSFDASGRWHGRAREPRPDYTHHCFVVARAAKQFFNSAHFDPALPRTNSATYLSLIRRVLATNPRTELPRHSRIVIPGYAHLREFSRDHEQLLKQECGSFWQSYFQRGHWRMVFPFSRSGQTAAATALLEKLRSGRPAILHVADFPSLRINHAVLAFRAEENAREIQFDVYDPNTPEQPTVLRFDRQTRQFCFPLNRYFPGGELDAYEVYCSACY